MVEDGIDPAFWEGVAQFNQQEFYACHDTLEAIWMEAIEPQRTFYQGVLQIAVALYHLGNDNLRGAAILLGEGIKRLRHYQPDYAAVDVTALVSQSAHLLTLLQQALSDPPSLPPALPLPHIVKTIPNVDTDATVMPR
jgi:uncharacterized protein